MDKVFTSSNVLSVLHQWPQAVSMDDGDLRTLHDMASAGAQNWKERLPWPDYLWLDVDGDFSTADGAIHLRRPNIQDPTGGVLPAAFPQTQWKAVQPKLPPSGQFRISERVVAMIELKQINTDLASKLSSYQPGMPWPEFVRLIFKWFGKRLRLADEQIAGGKRLFPVHDSRGVAIFVNGASPNLPADAVMAYFADALKTLPNLDCVIYLADRQDGQLLPLIAVKKNDPLLKRLHVQLVMMFRSFDYTGVTPTCRLGAQPEILARIEMDSRSRAIYRSWATGWRDANDCAPLPSISMKASFMRREEFTPGLSQTQLDKGLLDGCCTWDPGPPWDPAPRNLRVVPPGALPLRNPKELFPKMPPQVFALCFEPQIAYWGWHFTSVDDDTTRTPWETFFAACSMSQWSNFRWELGFHRLALAGLHGDTTRSSELMLRAYNLGENNAASAIVNGKERFDWLNSFVKEHRKLPAPVVGGCTDKGLRLLDGHIRLAVLMHQGIAEGFDLPMWLATPEAVENVDAN